MYKRFSFKLIIISLFAILNGFCFGQNCTFTIDPDLSLISPDATIEQEMETIFNRFSDNYLGTSTPSASSLNTAISDYNDLDISVSNGEISGSDIASFDDLRFLKTFAKYLKFNSTDASIIEMANNAVWLTGKQFCAGSLPTDNNGYEYRYFARAGALLRDFLSPENKDRFAYTLYKHNDDFKHIWAPVYDQEYQVNNNAINTDHIYNFSDAVLAYCTWFDTPEERYRQMRGMKRYMERFFSYTSGSSDGIKPDGSGFHHWTAYESYTYAYNQASTNLYYLRGTSFKPNAESYLIFRDAVMAKMLYGNDSRVMPLSIIGRKPYERILSTGSIAMRQLAIAGGDILNLPHADTIVAGFHNRLWNSNTELNYTGVLPLSAQEGAYPFNYSNALVYRKDNWVAVGKGFTDNLFGTEIYLNSNRYGRYQGYGALEIIYPGSLENGQGYNINTWDWNYNPGTTSILLPWEELQAEKARIDELQVYRFAGGLSLGNKNSNFLTKLHGEYGMFAMKFNERENTGWGTVFTSPSNHNNTFTFRKSQFFFDDMIVCLGSNINNDDTNNETITTLYQRLDNKPTDVIVDDVVTNMTSSFSSTDDHWVISNYGTGFYIFSESGIPTVFSGSQQTPNHDVLDSDLSGNPTANYNKGFINHGTNPIDASYEYIVIPNATTTAMSTISSEIIGGTKPYSVHQQDNLAHIIEYSDTDTDIWAFAVFEDNLSITNPNSVLKSVSNAAMLMYQINDAQDELLFSITRPELGFDWRQFTSTTSETTSITLEGDWILESSNPSFQIQSSPSGDSTIVIITTKDGLPEEALLSKQTITECVIEVPVFELHNCNDEGEFFVQIYLSETSFGSSFQVSGNNETYGPFEYGEDSYLIGPFLSTQTGFNLELYDTEFDQCFDNIFVEEVDCPILDCSIENVELSTGECNEENSYFIILDFEHNELGGGIFNLIYQNEIIGTYETADLPITIQNFEGNSESETLTICMADLEDCCASITFLTPQCETLLTWPGDGNIDGIANNMDILNMGIAYGFEGAERATDNINWDAQAAIAWESNFASGVNFVHADADGNGEVNMTDADVVGINYNLTQGEVTPFVALNPTDNSPALYVDMPEAFDLQQGMTFNLPIVFGNEDLPVENVYGIAFTLRYDPEVINPSSISLEYPVSWMGFPEADLIIFDYHDFEGGEIDVAITKINQNNVSGWGRILDFTGVIDNVTGVNETYIEITDVAAILSNEERFPVNTPIEITMITSTNNVNELQDFELFPNPTKDIVHIKNETGLSLQTIHFFDLNGKLLQTVKGESTFDLSSLTTGIYMAKIVFEDRIIYRKVVRI